MLAEATSSSALWGKKNVSIFDLVWSQFTLYLTGALVLSCTTFLCSVVRGLRFTDNFPLTLFRPLFLYGEGVTCNLVNYKCVDQHKTFITSSPSLSRSYKKFSIKQKNNCDSSYIKYLTLLSWPSTWSKQIKNCDLSHEKFTMNNKASCLSNWPGEPIIGSWGEPGQLKYTHRNKLSSSPGKAMFPS